MNLDQIKEEINKFDQPYYSQLKQDIAALAISKYRTNGFFVEFGACDGVHLSNTLLLEKSYHWTGILSEPSTKYFNKLRANRSVSLDARAVYVESKKKLNFKETDNQLDLSGLDHLFSNDKHSHKREFGTVYEVETISLLDLLKQHNAPRSINFLSIDTEGTEYDIISNFNFLEYEIDFITIEHNYIEENRIKIQNFLENNNYTRIFTDLSKWDDWYILNKIKDGL